MSCRNEGEHGWLSTTNEPVELTNLLGNLGRSLADSIESVSTDRRFIAALDGNIAFQARIKRAIYLAHSACAELETVSHMGLTWSQRQGACVRVIISSYGILAATVLRMDGRQTRNWSSFQ